MRQSFLLIGLFVLASCQSNKEPKAEVAGATTTDSASIVYPVPVLYSGTWEIGDPKNSVSILNMGNEWSAGRFEIFKTGLADSVTCYLADGSVISGSRDSVIAKFTAFRKMYAAVYLKTHSIISLKHRDTKEDWVCLWGKEITTTPQGKKDSVELQESWKLNSAGQAELCYQYAATIKPAKN